MLFCCLCKAHSETREIERKIKIAKNEAKREVKILLLGPGESGKSTIIKQARIIHGDGYSDKQLLDLTPVIYSNIVKSMQTLLDGLREFNIELETEGKNAMDVVYQVDTESIMELTDRLADSIDLLWKLPSIQECYRKRALIHLFDSAGYYFSNMPRIRHDSYIPTEADVLRSRVPTTGIVEYKFSIDEVTFRMVDVGGQRAERRKWIHCFAGMTTMIFMASLSEYDQVLYEDRCQNRMRESIFLFETIVNYYLFATTSIILFMNKTDLFEEKLYESQFSTYFPEYKDDFEDCNKVKWFILNLFFQCNRNSQKTIYSHFTCATDTKKMEVIFSSIKDIILKNNLKNYHLI